MNFDDFRNSIIVNFNRLFAKIKPFKKKKKSNHTRRTDYLRKKLLPSKMLDYSRIREILKKI